MKQIKDGIDFINCVYKDLKKEIKDYSSEKVLHDNTQRYLEDLEETFKEAFYDYNKFEALKIYYYKKYIIKKLPESYIEYEKGGLSDYDDEITEEQINAELANIQHLQKESLDTWLNFVTNPNIYPFWYRYFILRSVLKLGTYYKNLKEFTKRSASTTDIFVELDSIIIDKVYNLIEKVIKNEELTIEESKIINNGLNFQNLYKSLDNENSKYIEDEEGNRYISINQKK